MGLRRYLANKTVWYLGALVVAVVLNFLLPRLVPGNPVDVLVSKMGQGGLSSEAQALVYEQFMKEFGLDRSLWEQFLLFVTGAFQGNFGLSFSYYPTPVSDLVAQSLPYTLVLQIPAIALGWIIGNVLGAVAAYKGGGWDKSVFTTLGIITRCPTTACRSSCSTPSAWCLAGSRSAVCTPGHEPEWTWEFFSALSTGGCRSFRCC